MTEQPTGAPYGILLNPGQMFRSSFSVSSYRVHTKGVMQQHATLRRVLRRFSNSKCFLEGFLEGACKGFQYIDKVLRRVLRREWFIEGA